MIPINCAILQLLADHYAEYCAASSSSEYIEQTKCNSDSFISAVKAVYKFRASKRMTDIKNEIRVLQTSQEDQEQAKQSSGSQELSEPNSINAVKASLIAVSEKFVALAEQTKGKQSLWLRELVKGNPSQDLTSLSSSVRSLMEIEADQLLRAVQSMQEFQTLGGVGDAITDGNHLAEFLSRYVPMLSIPEDDWSNFGLSDCQATMKEAQERVVKSITLLTSELQKFKANIQANTMYHRQVALSAELGDEFEKDKFAKFLPTSETQAQDEKLMQQLSGGGCFCQKCGRFGCSDAFGVGVVLVSMLRILMMCCTTVRLYECDMSRSPPNYRETLTLTISCRLDVSDLLDMEANVRVAWSWLTCKELADGPAGGVLTELMANYKGEPTGKLVAVNLANMYAADLLVNFDPKKIVAEALSFHKFITNTLKITKKEISNMLMDRMDKVVKDAKDLQDLQVFKKHTCLAGSESS